MSITERLQKYMDFKGLNPNKITIEANLSVGLIGKALKNNTGLNSDTIEKILYRYIDLNPEWFVIGNGEMLKTKSEENINKEKVNKKVNINVNKPKVQKILTNEDTNVSPLLQAKDETIAQLKERVAGLEQDKKDLKKDKENAQQELQELKHQYKLASKEIEELKNVQGVGATKTLVG